MGGRRRRGRGGVRLRSRLDVKRWDIWGQVVHVYMKAYDSIEIYGGWCLLHYIWRYGIEVGIYKDRRKAR